MPRPKLRLYIIGLYGLTLLVISAAPGLVTDHQDAPTPLNTPTLVATPTLIATIAGAALVLIAAVAAIWRPALLRPLAVPGILMSWNLWIIASTVTLVACLQGDQSCTLWQGHPPLAYAILHLGGGILAGLATIWPGARRTPDPAAPLAETSERRAPHFQTK